MDNSYNINTNWFTSFENKRYIELLDKLKKNRRSLTKEELKEFTDLSKTYCDLAMYGLQYPQWVSTPSMPNTDPYSFNPFTYYNETR